MAEPLLTQDVLRKLEQLTIVARKVSAGKAKGERRSRRRGSSTDFADYRNYAPGDDLRFLDWKIYGRLERLFIKLFLEEEDLRVHILIDASASMEFGEPPKLLYARRTAAALGYICLARMDSLRVQTFGDGLLDSYGPSRGKANRGRYFDFLSSIEAVQDGTTNLLRAFQSVAQANPLRGMVVVISDFYDFSGYEEAFRRLFAANFEVLAIQVLSPQELKPEHQGDIRLVDTEFGTTTDISMGKRVIDTYQRTLAAFSQGLKDYLVGRGGHYLLVSTETPFDRLVLDILRRRGFVR